MSSPGRIHDPLFHFETHFPERLTRLHINQEYGNHPVQRKNRKSRAARQGVRYKTQPVTFDEIQEVDEENIKEEDKDKTEGLRNQFAAFSKSMDGLLPKQKKKTADCIDENVPLESCHGHGRSVKTSLSEIGRVQSAELRLAEEDEENKENKENESSNFDTSKSVPGLPPSGPNTRRQRTTAKAKKRQMQADAESGGDKGT